MFQKERLHTILRNFEMFVPLNCPLCGGVPADGSANMFCADCLKKLPWIRPPVCPGCGGEHSGILEVCPDCLHAEQRRPWRHALALMKMDGAAKELIYQYKYRKGPELARPLGRLAAASLELSGIRPDVIVPTPLHWFRYLQRGYNQAELLCRRIGQECGIPVETFLRRKKWTRQQAKLDRKQRIQNLHQAFSVIDSTNCRERCILLVDDVMTTGSTLSAAAETLLGAGAAEVDVLVLARRQRD